MLRFALFGAGRIGRMHADNLMASPRATLQCVYDVHEPAAREVADRLGISVASDVASVLNNTAVDAVLIASSTDTHVDLITASARARKAVLCEKPIDLDIERVNRCGEQLGQYRVPVQIGFNRRFDPTHRAVRDAAEAGEVGQIEQIIITSRDPIPPPADYIRVSGGLFRDMMIHDFDYARFLAGQEFVAVSALGGALVDPNLVDLDDIDTAMVLMHTASGVQCHINCSRRAVYGYDQRIEVFGSKGMLQSDNPRRTQTVRYTGQVTGAREPLQNSFIDRYAKSYSREIDDFVATVEQGGMPSVTFEDGRRALMLADAANESLRTGRVVGVSSE